MNNSNRKITIIGVFGVQLFVVSLKCVCLDGAAMAQTHNCGLIHHRVRVQDTLPLAAAEACDL